METLGAVSGAVLGYTVNNLPGAYYGYQVGRYFGQRYNMPPITRTRNQAGRRILSAMRGWRRRGYPGGATSRALSGMRANRASNNVVTKQRDFGNQYRFKKMPKRKRKQWKKFVKKVTAVELKNAATKTVVFNHRMVQTGTPGNQAFMSIALYGINGAPDSNNAIGYQDMLKLFDNDPDIKQEAVAGVNFPANGKLHMQTAVLDFTLRNLGEVDAEVDIYYGYHVKNVNNINILQQTADTLRQHFIATTSDPITSGNTSIGLGLRGATPFDCSSALSESGFHILKKQKFNIEPSASVFIQHRDSKNYELDQNDLSTIGYAKKKLTYEVLIVHKPSVTSVDDTVSTIGCGVTRKYGYSVLAKSNQAVSAYTPTFTP